jgi:hypothetical protein
MTTKAMIITTLWALAALCLAGCSDDTENTPKDTGVDLPADAAVEASADALPVDTAKADADPFACDATGLGAACTPGGSSGCAGGKVCLALPGGSTGFCTCPCRRDDLSTKVQEEESCPTGFSCGVSGGEDRCMSLLANTAQPPSCAKVAAVMADPTDPPFLLAARSTPPTYPFTVVGLRYFLAAPTSAMSSCDDGLAHEVVLFVGTATTPPASPTIVETLQVPAATATPDGRRVVLELTTPLTLKSGEQLYVAQKVVYDAAKGKSICPQLCSDTAKGEASFTNDTSATAPYTWTSFAAKTWPGDLITAVLGFSG